MSARSVHKAVVERTGAVVKQTRVWSGYFILLLGALMLFGIVRTAFFGEVDAEKHIWMEISLLLLIALVAERLVQQWKQPFVMVLLVTRSNLLLEFSYDPPL